MHELLWVVQDTIDPLELRPELRRTLEILETVARDPKRAKASLLLPPRCPQFPDGQWTQLLSGRSIDLDHVFSSLYSISHDIRRTEKSGKYGVSVWVIAYNVFIETALFVFPHRTRELSKYGRHIRQLFASFPEGLHLRIIYYDCAVCLRASWHATYCSLILPSSVTSTHFGFRMVGPVAVPSLLIPLV